jgi:CheY-like chemotaxis protein
MNNSLVLREEQTLIEKSFTGSIDYKTLYLNEDYEITDTFLNEVVEDIITTKEYNNIFIPLCFGPIMSDFNGLRLATHIRCTQGINQNKNIYIFSFVDISYLINHECFDILKTKGVMLIKYNFHTIQSIIDNNFTVLELSEIPSEIKKINLKIPANYEDNHSVANEWAIYRWSQAVDANDKGIEKITDIQNNNLYFKYLKSIYPIRHLDRLAIEKLKINFEGQSNVLYIDDEAEKGWKEIFETIFLDKNKNIDFLYLDNELNDKSKEEICELALQTIIDEDIDLVILDFRLHKEDFENKSIEEITGYKILKKIKEHNKGIQVIVFSATNKIWNLQALQEAGANGFIIKESPENSLDYSFTEQSIKSFISTTEECLRRVFLKNFYSNLDTLKKELIPRKNYAKSNNPLPKEFVDETLKWFELSLNFLNLKTEVEQLISAFLIYFTIIENISNRVIEIENPIKEVEFYKFQFRKNFKRLNHYIEDSDNPGFYRKTNTEYKSPKRSLRWDIKIYNTIDFISDNNLSLESINDLVKKRNDIIHSNSTLGKTIEIKKDDILFLNRIIYEGLLNVV